jgi:SP family myo-inositol transporter-like MFS transporter 13
MILLREEWPWLKESPWEQEAIVSSTVGLAAVGALLSATANRVFGRKPVIVASALIFTVGALLMAFARGFSELLIGRMVVGLAVGLASSTVPLYLAELAPAKMRGRLVAANNSCIVVGQVVAAIVDGLFSSTPHGWRFMLGLGGVPSVLQLVGLMWLPESPRWLVSNGREDEAREVLRKLRADSSELDAVVSSELDEIVTALESEGLAPRRARQASVLAVSALAVRPSASLEC